MSTTCAQGVYECGFAAKFVPSGVDSCAAYDGSATQPSHLRGLVVAGGVTMMVMAFGIGANDASNSWATTVGSGALSLRKAVWVGAVAEFLGAVTLGAGVAKTIKGTSDIKDPKCWACGYCDSEMSSYMGGMFAALVATAVFLLLATFTRMPVSTTHAIVGGVVGMTVFGAGGHCLNWAYDGGLAGIAASWVISPVLSGVVAIGCYAVTKVLVVSPPSCFTSSSRWRWSESTASHVNGGIILTLQSFSIAFMILLNAEPTKGWERSLQLGISVGLAAFVSCACGKGGGGG